jgi:hypothetical protein
MKIKHKKQNNSLFMKAFSLLFYIFIFVIFLNNSFNYLDPDLGWHLKIGESILEEKQVPSFQIYDYTLGDSKWVDHEWLSNLILYGVFDNFGYIVVNIFFALLMLIIILLLNNFLLRKYVNKKYIFTLYFFELIAIYGMLPSLGVRMQEISILFLLIQLILIDKYSREKNFKILFWFIPLYILWINLHAGFILGVAIYFLWLALKFFEKVISRTQLINFIEYKAYSYKELFTYLTIGLGIIISTIFTPYFLSLHKYLSGVFTDTSYMMLISEWLPIYYIPVINNQLIYAVIIGVVLILSIYYALLKSERRKINLWHFGLSFLFLIFAFKSKRHFPLFFIVSMPFLMAFISKEYIFSLNYFDKTKYILIVKSFLLASMIIAIFAYIVFTNFTQAPFSNEKFCTYSPCEAVDFLKNSDEYRDLKIFNNYGEGGFMIWQWPEKRLFIDGRFPQYEFAGHTLLEEYGMFRDREKSEEKLQEYNIEMVLLKNSHPLKINWLEKIIIGAKDNILPGGNSLADYLEGSDEWERVFHNRPNSIYVRK